MRRSMSHMLNRELSRGWGAWHEMVAERKAFMQKLRKGVSFMVNRKLACLSAGVGFAMAWLGWTRLNGDGMPRRSEDGSRCVAGACAIS